MAAASARLCVETVFLACKINLEFAAASARLCVETRDSTGGIELSSGSRLRAAVC